MPLHKRMLLKTTAILNMVMLESSDFYKSCSNSGSGKFAPDSYWNSSWACIWNFLW